MKHFYKELKYEPFIRRYDVGCHDNDRHMALNVSVHHVTFVQLFNLFMSNFFS